MAEAEARPKALALAAQFVELTRKAVNSWPQVKPWLEKVDIDALTAQVRRTLCGPVGVDGLSGWVERLRPSSAAKCTRQGRTCCQGRAC